MGRYKSHTDFDICAFIVGDAGVGRAYENISLAAAVHLDTELTYQGQCQWLLRRLRQT